MMVFVPSSRNLQVAARSVPAGKPLLPLMVVGVEDPEVFGVEVEVAVDLLGGM